MNPASFQSIILRLQNYWAEQGCLIWQPYHTEVGAGTMNPATFLRVLGPEPWWVAYVEPSFRPADGRYGENPNRWQHYYQFQVILKPDPGDPQERYLRSLQALGIDLQHHDIRFVEDNWQSPTIGAWGLGWEVWLDGQEITQYTYFQQAGGQPVDPVAVEITYGLERIALALQEADTFLDLAWNEAVTYGELRLRSEVEYSTYNFELASIERLRTLYETYEQEAQHTLQAGLIQPAHDYVLKCSHVFNLLDARGAVGVTERADLFGRMRKLARGVALGYEAQRAEAGHPLLGRWQASPAAPDDSDPGKPPANPALFVLELGTEELPAGDLTAAIGQLEERAAAMLADQRLEAAGVRVLGTPRRLVLLIDDLATSQAVHVSLVKGPPAERAFDADGVPTPAAEGFARSRGIDIGDLRVEEIDGGRYAVAEVRQQGRPTQQVLRETLPELIGGLSFERTMRWNSSGVTFARPLRWLLALHAGQIVPIEFAGLAAGRTSRGLRWAEPSTLSINSAEDYLEAIAGAGIVLDPAERRSQIEQQIERLAKQAGGRVVEDPDLLAEVTQLVEQPTAFLGSFDEAFLVLPRPVLLEVMRKHQRYFALEQDGKLLASFIAVRNGGLQHLEVVRSGNEHVLQARFADAAYFVERDRHQPLEDYLPALATLTFETSLGSMLDKVGRFEALVEPVAEMLSLSAEERVWALRAAHLAKADLATRMVVEMTSLQGEMGRIYAGASGEPAQVADAIAEHYLPRFAGDRVPQSSAGLAVGLADRLDSLAGLFGAGKEPSGAGDPFALRRTAIGLIEALVASGQSFDLRRGLALAADLQPIEVDQDIQGRCLAFITRRQQALLLAEGRRHDAVTAVLEAQGHDPAAAAVAVMQLEAWIGADGWDSLLQNFARCIRITRDLDQVYVVDEDKLSEDASRQLLAAYQKAAGTDGSLQSIDALFRAFEPMVPDVEHFFEEVLVMSEDEAERRNRLGLLQRVAGLADGLLDVSKLEGF